MLIKLGRLAYGAIRRLVNQHRGSVTLEASIIFPVMVLMLFTFCVFSLYLYEKLVLVDSAVYSVRQAAANWNNSAKNLETGSLSGSYRTDGLYWRITRDFGEAPLVKVKKDKTDRMVRELIKDGYLARENSPEVLVKYDNNLLKRTVMVEIKERVCLPLTWLSSLLPAEIFSGAKAEVAEPVEFVRSIDLTAEYLAEVTSYLKKFDREAGEGPTGRIVLASVKSSVNGNKVYHYPGCRYIRQIKNENLIQFGSEAEANFQGFHICVECAKTRMWHQ